MSGSSDALPFAEAGDGSSTARPLSVRDLTRRIERALVGMGRVSVEGEISRVTRAASGHVYFDLKDLDAKLACTIWKSQLASAARFELGEGLKVVAHGKLDVYAPRGTYSLNVQRLEPAGIGALLAEFERRKQELAARGWFDRKRPWPAFPRRIGLATSRDGAAWADFLRTRSQRWPAYPLLFTHTPVQGAGAAQRIAEAIQRLDRAGVDVIVICRGGGSLEDLWAFNELVVAEAIRASATPVVCGVGHEIDTSLADLVSDRRAHTPTDAAQTVIPDRAATLEQLSRARAHLARAVDLIAQDRARRLERAANARALRDPRSWIALREQRRLALRARLEAAIRRRLAEPRALLHRLELRLARGRASERLAARRRALDLALARLSRAGSRTLERGVARQALLAARLEALSPLAVMQRGFSITRGPDGSILRDAAGLRPGEEIATDLLHGRVISTVRQTEPDSATAGDRPR